MSTKTNAVLMLCIGGFFLFGGRARWGSNKAALTRQRQSNQQPSGLLVSLRVPISRNVYQDKCCADALHRRIFLFSGVPSGTPFILMQPQPLSRKGQGLLFLYPFIWLRICAISALV